MLDPIYRFAANRLAPAGPNGRLSILIYHRVLARTDPLFPNEVTADSFDDQMHRLKSAFNVIPLPDAVAMLKSGRLPARAASITFDDGYADNLTLALPILQRHGLHATFFIATSYLNGGRMFNDTVIEAVRNCPHATLDLNSLGLGAWQVDSDAAKTAAIEGLLPKVKYLPLGTREDTVARIAELAGCGELPNDLMMTSKQLKALHGAGMEIGGHTARHPILASLDDDAAKKEIADGKHQLESLLGASTRLFAFPNGKPGKDYRPEQAAIVRELGFDAAVSTAWGAASSSHDPFQLPRFTPWSPKRSRFVPMLLSNLRTK